MLFFYQMGEDLRERVLKKCVLYERWLDSTQERMETYEVCSGC